MSEITPFYKDTKLYRFKKTLDFNQRVQTLLGQLLSSFLDDSQQEAGQSSQQDARKISKISALR